MAEVDYGPLAAAALYRLGTSAAESLAGQHPAGAAANALRRADLDDGHRDAAQSLRARGHPERTNTMSMSGDELKLPLRIDTSQIESDL
jgi:hypothetical protein